MSPQPDKGIKFITVNTEGKAQLCLSNLESFTLSNMFVQKVIFGGDSWIAFLGYKNPTMRGSQFIDDDVSANSSQTPTEVIEFFLQSDVNQCMLSLEANKDVMFNDIAAREDNTLAIALQNGAVAIHQIEIPF